MVGVNHAAAVQTHDGVGQEIVGGDKRILYRCIRQFAVIQGHSTSQYLGGTVPFLVDVTEVLHTAVETIDQHQRHLGLILGQGGTDDKVALACC